jgi:hypothetical protein
LEMRCLVARRSAPLLSSKTRQRMVDLNSGESVSAEMTSLVVAEACACWRLKQSIQIRALTGIFRFGVMISRGWASPECNDVSCSRLGTCWWIVGVASMNTCEIGIDVKVNWQVAGWLYNCSFVCLLSEIAQKSLDGRWMTAFGIVIESRHLADGEGEVGTSICGEVKEHNNNWRVAPSLLHGLTVRVNSQGLLGWGRLIWITICHAGGLNDFMKWVLFVLVDGVLDRILDKFNS